MLDCVAILDTVLEDARMTQDKPNHSNAAEVNSR